MKKIDNEVKRLNKELNSFITNAKRIVLIFMGNTLRTDDAVGIIIGEELQKRLKKLENTRLIIAHNTPINFIGKIVEFKPTHILFVDGIIGDFSIGTVILGSPDVIKNTNSLTTHYQDFEQIISFIKDLYPVEFKTIIIGIQVGNIEVMDQMSLSVKKSGEIVLNVLATIIEQFEKRMKS